MPTSNVVTQNGNTTATWVLSGGAVSNRDVLVQVHLVGNSGLKIDNTMSRISPNRYEFRATVVGPNAVAFSVAFAGVT